MPVGPWGARPASGARHTVWLQRSDTLSSTPDRRACVTPCLGALGHPSPTQHFICTVRNTPALLDGWGKAGPQLQPQPLGLAQRAKLKMLVAQACLTLCGPKDCSPPGSSVHGILQARILEWVAMPSSRESSQPRDQTRVSCMAGGFFNVSVTRGNLKVVLVWG